MRHSLKALGLALVAVLAMSAMVASAASAATFTASAGAGTSITAADSGKVQLKVTGQTITCTTAHYEGTAPGTSFTEIGVEAEFGHCTTGLGTTATVTGFGQHGEKTPCTFNLQADGKVDLNCPAGQEVTIDASTCVIHMPAQQNVGTLAYTSHFNLLNLTIHINITKITANHTDGAFCPLTGSGHASSAELVTPAGEPLVATASAGSISWDS